MPRLSEKAFHILQTEIQSASNDPTTQVQRELTLRRLEKLRTQEGTPLTGEELRDTIVDLLPDFNDKALKTAAKANGSFFSKKPSSKAHSSSTQGRKVASQISKGAIVLLTLVGGVYLANLPIPWLRWTVAKSAPLLLTPSFMSMESHYRGAIASITQADQLINQATAPEDFELGSTQVQIAQQHLEALPVWFIGYYPSQYCGFAQCSWRYTVDEFRSAREDVARMSAKLFQEGNARTQLEEKDQAVAEARQAFTQAKNEAGRSKAIAQWQAAIDTLSQIPAQTLAGRMAQEKLVAYDRDFQQTVGFAAGSTRTGHWMEAAKQFAQAASKPRKVPPTLIELQKIKELWESAIERIEKITVDDPNYLAAQQQLIKYQTSLDRVEIQTQDEKDSLQAFDTAQQMKQSLLDVTTNNPTVDRGRVARALQEIIDELRKVKKGTTVYSEAQNLMRFAQNRLK